MKDPVFPTEGVFTVDALSLSDGGSALMTPQNGTTVQYAIDPRASQFTVQAFASGLISAVAHSPKIAIRDWSGNVSFVPESLKKCQFESCG